MIVLRFRDRLNPQRGANLSAALAEEGIIAFLFQHPDYLPYILSEDRGNELYYRAH